MNKTVLICGKLFGGSAGMGFPPATLPPAPPSPPAAPGCIDVPVCDAVLRGSRTHSRRVFRA